MITEYKTHSIYLIRCGPNVVLLDRYNAFTNGCHGKTRQCIIKTSEGNASNAERIHSDYYHSQNEHALQSGHFQSDLHTFKQLLSHMSLMLAQK